MAYAAIVKAKAIDFMPVSDGWIEVIDLSGITPEDYYFAFYDKHGVMLGLAFGTDGRNGSSNKTVWFLPPAAPLRDKTKLWCIERHTTTGQYTLRAYTTQAHLSCNIHRTEINISISRVPPTQLPMPFRA